MGIRKCRKAFYVRRNVESYRTGYWPLEPCYYDYSRLAARVMRKCEPSNTRAIITPGAAFVVSSSSRTDYSSKVLIILNHQLRRDNSFSVRIIWYKWSFNMRKINLSPLYFVGIILLAGSVRGFFPAIPWLTIPASFINQPLCKNCCIFLFFQSSCVRKPRLDFRNDVYYV